MHPGQSVLIYSGEDGQAGPFLALVVCENGDQIDVETPDGFTDCFPAEWVWYNAAERGTP
jgi:hypothetical protein